MGARAGESQEEETDNSAFLGGWYLSNADMGLGLGLHAYYQVRLSALPPGRRKCRRVSFFSLGALSGDSAVIYKG